MRSICLSQDFNHQPLSRSIDFFSPNELRHVNISHKNSEYSFDLLIWKYQRIQSIFEYLEKMPQYIAFFIKKAKLNHTDISKMFQCLFKGKASTYMSELLFLLHSFSNYVLYFFFQFLAYFVNAFLCSYSKSYSILLRKKNIFEGY